MSEINVLHPFREGNGRTYREFVRQLAKFNGYNLNWAKVDHKDIFNATLKSVVETDNLEEIIFLCLE
ncbi:Adenosine monophosphate-protein transferase VbhT [compost metagenome]